MKDLLLLILAIYLISLIVSLIGAFFKFIYDVNKWHDKEEKAVITPSNEEAEETTAEESEVNENDTNAREHHTPTIFDTGD